MLEGTSADSHTKVWIPSPAARATKARSRTVGEIGARSVGKIKNPPLWAKSCPENSSSSAQAVLTSTPVSSQPEVAPLGLSTPVNSSANWENVVALAAILRDVLSPGGSPESARAARLARSAGYVVRQKFPMFAARDQTKHLSIIVDSGAEVNLACPAHKHFLTNVTKLNVPLQLETAGGDLTLDVIGDLLCGGIVCHGCVFSIPCSQSVSSALPEVRKMDISTRDVLKAMEC